MRGVEDGVERGINLEVFAASAGTDPPSIFGADLVAWYKADTQVYNDAGSTLATNGQTVQQWNDQSGNGYNLSMATAGNRPTFNTTSFNSTTGITFNGKGMQTGLVITPIESGTTISAFVVLNISAAGNHSDRILALNISGQHDFGTGGHIPLYESSTTQISAFNGSNLSTFTFSTATNYRMGSIYDGAHLTTYLNNSANSADALSFTFSASAYQLTVGEDDTLSEAMDGVIAEIVLVKRAASSGDRLNLDNYFKTKWSL